MRRLFWSIAIAILIVPCVFTVIFAQARPATVLKAANLRAGPGTTYAKVGSAQAGQTVQIVDSNSDHTWYKLDTGAWVAAFLVKPQETLAPGTPSPLPSTPPPATPTPTPTTACHSSYDPCVPIASDVDCLGGTGNGPAYVQGPVRVIGPDVYGLDRDHDGIGCE